MRFSALRIGLWLSILLGNGFAFCQQTQIGLVASLGTHEQKLGILAHWSPLYGQLQGHARAQISYNFQHLGNQGHGWELQAALGLAFAWGEKEEYELPPYLFLLSNQTQRTWSVGYAYMLYLDQQATSQYSGMLSVGYGPFLLRLENDFLAWRDYDRYRSGATSLDYWRGDMMVSLRTVIWTGDPYDKNNPIRQKEGFPSRAGYLDLFGVPYGNCSSGIFSIRALRTLPFGQTAFMDLGLDAEQIRNFFQNRLVHDNPLLPINWGDFKNPHVPMLDEKGNSYLYMEGQKIRKPKLYFQAGLNQAALY